MIALFLVGMKVTAEAPLSKTYTLSTSVHNDVDNTYNYNRVIGIAQLKAFSCTKTVKCHFFVIFTYFKCWLRSEK